MTSPPVLQWVNHASYIIEHGGVRLMTDPWLFGSAFDDGWDLVSESVFGVDDFRTITHIWISHEHPDHFAPGVLSAIPQEVRRSITVLFQRTRDGRVAGFCRKLGFQVLEMAPRKAYRIADGLVCTCGPVRPIDSWLLVEAGGARLLNLNDCVIASEATARSIIGTVGAVDVLLTQFSYANWVSNEEHPEQRVAAAKDKLERIRLQTRVFEPRVVVPFASMVWFSNEENHAQNDGINRVDDACRFIEEHTTARPVVLYPGDRWQVLEEVDNEAALERYATDYQAALSQGPRRPRGDAVPMQELERLAQGYVDRMAGSFDDLALRLCRRRGRSRVNGCTVHLTDLDTTVAFQVCDGLREAPDEAPDIHLSSACMAYVLRHDWGLGTLMVNGRFRATEDGRRRFASALRFGSLRSTGREFHFRSLTATRLVIGQALLSRLGFDGALPTEDDFSMHAAWDALRHRGRP